MDIRRSLIVGGPAAEIPHTVLQAVLAAEAEEESDDSERIIDIRKKQLLDYDKFVQTLPEIDIYKSEHVWVSLDEECSSN